MHAKRSKQALQRSLNRRPTAGASRLQSLQLAQPHACMGCGPVRRVAELGSLSRFMRVQFSSSLLASLLLVFSAINTRADSIRYKNDWRIPAGQRGIGFVGVAPDTTVICFVSTSFRVYLPFYVVAAISISLPASALALLVYAMRRRHTTS